MVVFSPQPVKKCFFLHFVAKMTPPPPPGRVNMYKNEQFLQWILKDDDVYFQKITAS